MKRRWPALLLALLLAAVLAWAVVRTAIVYAVARVRPELAAAVAPNDPRVIIGRANVEMREKMGLVGGPTKIAVRDALRRSPMLEEPMLLAGIDSLLKKDNRRAREFLEHALIRNPRSRLARLFMLELDLRANDVRRAVANMAILGRLLPDAQAVFVPELARMARDPQTSQALGPTLRADPVMLARVLDHLAQKGASPAIVLRLAGGNLRAPPPDDLPDWRETLLKAMVARGNFEGARRLWSVFSGVDPGRSNAVYDGSFKGLPGLAPFNWTFSSSEIGAAEREKRGGLQVEYYGRAPGDLATQVLTLPPGRFRLAFHAEGDLHDAQHRMFWRVLCHRKDMAMLLDLPVANVSYAGRTIAGDFTVPRDCSGQWLKLVGEPTEFPKIESVTIRDLRIQRFGAAAL